MQTHIHCGDVVLVGLSDLLHDLHLGVGAVFQRAFDCDGPLWVVQRQVLKTEPVTRYFNVTCCFEGGAVTVVDISFHP